MSKTGEREKQIKIEQETKERKQMFSEQSRKKIEEAYCKVKEDLGYFMEPVCAMDITWRSRIWL